MPPSKRGTPKRKTETKPTPPTVVNNPQGMVGTNFGTVINNFFRNVDEKLLKRGFVLLALLVVAGLTALYFGLKPPGKKLMTGEFRIAVLRFDEHGKGLPDNIGYTIANGIHLRLKDDLQEIAVGPKVELWGPDDLGDTLHGATAQERAEKAEQLAKQIQAYMIVYGVVEETENGMQVVPEFYLDTLGFQEGSEVIGQYVGSPFSLPGAATPAWQFRFDQQMQLRTDIISSLAEGLTFFAVQDYQQALEKLQTIEQIEGWQDDEGKEVLYALIGFAAGKTEDYQLTETALRKAIALNPRYARPYIGLANLDYLLALQPYTETNDVKDVDQSLLDECFEQLQAAEDAPEKPPLAEVETKIHFARGQCYWLKTFSGQLPSFDLAVAEFRAVITAYDDGRKPGVYEYAGESYARMGLIYKLTNQLPKAAEYYQKAIDTLGENIPKRRDLYQERLEEIQKLIAQPSP